MNITTNSPEETIGFGVKMGNILGRGDVVSLQGDLGSGKTTIIKGIARGAGVSGNEHVSSPSFVLVKEYKGRLPVYHVDLYRLEGLKELDTIGFEEYMDADGIVLIEWGQKAQGLLPEEYLQLDLSIEGERKRKIKISAKGSRFKELLAGL